MRTVTDRRPLILPPAVGPGDVIGVAAPAGPFDPDLFRAGTDRLTALGYELKIPDAVYNRTGFLAGNDLTRARTLMELWADPEVKAVMAARGGYGCLRLLDLIDYDEMARTPKMMIGFSDITALLLALHQRCGLASVHGPVVTSLGGADDETLEHFARLISGRSCFPRELDPDGVIVPGLARGPLIGGNLTLLIDLLATPFRPDFNGALLFIEDVGEVPYRLDRKLATLRLAGVLDEVAGLLIGDFSNCGPEEEVREVVDEAVAWAGLPAARFPFGHRTRNLALPMGVSAVLDADAAILDLDSPFPAP